MHPHTRAAASWARSGRTLAEVLGLLTMAQQTTQEIVARPTVKQRLKHSRGLNWIHQLLRRDNPSRVLQNGAIEMCDVAVAGGNDYELRRYAVFFTQAADLVAEARLRGDLPRESVRVRRIRELQLELDAQLALERARETNCPKAYRVYADAQARDAANDLSEATLARIEAELAEATSSVARSRLDASAPGAA